MGDATSPEGSANGFVRGPHWSWYCRRCDARGDEPTEQDAALALHYHADSHATAALEAEHG